MERDWRRRKGGFGASDAEVDRWKRRLLQFVVQYHWYGGGVVDKQEAGR
jgi:hypothetical protein